jgi:carboxyl-terminal processing protease
MFHYRPRMMMAGLFAASCLVDVARGDDSTFDYRSATKAATMTLQKEHYSRRKLDDKLSAEWLAAFVAQLDPRRMYFLQSDLAEFQAFENVLDDHAKTGDFQFPELVRKRYRERVASAVGHAISFIDAKHDYSADESIPLQFDDYAKTEDERRERWRLCIKCELLVEKAHGRPADEVRSHLRGRYERIAAQTREMTDERLCQIFVDALAKCLDQHSAYYSPTYSAISSFTFVRHYHLGLMLRHDRGHYLITRIYAPGPSRDAMSLIGWELMAIKRTNGNIVDFVELHPDDAIGTIQSGYLALKSDKRVVLELVHPTTLQRMSIEWDRVQY